MKCVKNHDVEILKSNAGFYIGTTVENEEYGFLEPYCRISGYYRNKQEAEEAMKSIKDNYRICNENMFCNEGRGCFIR